jgi:hypothetical protein
MYWINFFIWPLAFNHRLQTEIHVPYLKFEHAQVFKTVILNQAVDVATLVVPDSLTVLVFYPIVFGFTSILQIIFKGGYMVATSMYYLGSDIDDFLLNRNFTKEKPKPVVPPQPTEEERPLIGRRFQR